MRYLAFLGGWLVLILLYGCSTISTIYQDSAQSIKESTLRGAGVYGLTSVSPILGAFGAAFWVYADTKEKRRVIRMTEEKNEKTLAEIRLDGIRQINDMSSRLKEQQQSTYEANARTDALLKGLTAVDVGNAVREAKEVRDDEEQRGIREDKQNLQRREDIKESLKEPGYLSKLWGMLF